jgi:hypothetical protein
LLKLRHDITIRENDDDDNAVDAMEATFRLNDARAARESRAARERRAASAAGDAAGDAGAGSDSDGKTSAPFFRSTCFFFSFSAWCGKRRSCDMDDNNNDLHIALCLHCPLVLSPSLLL